MQEALVIQIRQVDLCLDWLVASGPPWSAWLGRALFQASHEVAFGWSWEKGCRCAKS